MLEQTKPLVNSSLLARKLIEFELIKRAQLAQLTQSIDSGNDLARVMLQQRLINLETWRRFCQQAFGLAYFDLTELDSELLFQPRILQSQIAEFKVLPISLDGTNLTLLTADPSAEHVKAAFALETGLNANLACCDPLLLAQKLAETSSELSIDRTFISNKESNVSLDARQINDGITGYQADVSIVSYVDKLLSDAITSGASDIHFEPYQDEYRVRFRIDGVLSLISTPPSELSHRLSARLKVLSNMDIAEKRLPQDGRLKLSLSEQQDVEFRVSSLPTLWGEKIVLRVLQSSDSRIELQQLGLTLDQQALFEQVLRQPQGLILVTGPTGSGKSVSLYAGLNLLNTDESNIATAEDPVEVEIKGINQVQINNKTGLNFASALRAFLRQDPDIIMLGEIRDLETAEIAIKASQTGHLVLSTLHTNSAAETINRLVNMGVANYNIVSALSLVIAQRLVRRLCNHCKQVEPELPIAELTRQGFTASQCQQLILYNAKGCHLCHQGYKGRIGIFEVIKPDAELKQLILNNGQVSAINALLQSQQVVSLRQAGLSKVLSGETSLAELNRVTKA